MANGQSGPPASSRQVAYLLSLVQKAGHASFRDARGPLGLTQRQAGGKFAVGEASELIDLLLADPTGSSIESVEVVATKKEQAADARRSAELARVVRGLPADLMADELRLRGWNVSEPS